MWEQTATMIGAAGSAAAALAVVANGCTANDTRENAGMTDCSAQVRLDGVVYTSHGYTDHEATRHVPADKADCHDAGEDSVGSVFPNRRRQVTTWTFPGYPPETVLGVRFDQDSFAVFVAESVPSRESDRIFRALNEPDS